MEADLWLVQSLGEADARLRMLQHLAARVTPDDPYARSAEFLVFGLLAALLALGAAALLPIAAVGWPGIRERSPRTTATSAIALAFAGLVAAAGTSGILLAVAPAFPVTPLLAPSALQLALGVGAPLALVVILSLVVSTLERRRDPTVRGRRMLQQVLLLASVLGSLLYLVLGLLAMEARGRFLRQWRRPGLTDLQLVTRALGPRWRQPRLTPDAWEASPPPAAPGPHR